MKRLLLVAALSLIGATFAFSQQGSPKLEAALIQMDKDWTAAELKGDTQAAGMFVADDFWETTPDGKVMDKKAYLADLKATKDTDVADQYVVRFFGNNMAVMTHRGTVRGQRDYQYRSTHVWMNRGGKWQIVAHHSSEIPAMANDAAASDKTRTSKPKVAKPSAAAAAAPSN
jgi:hypothetical protein